MGTPKKIPVLFTIFNRKNVAIEAFQSIRQYQPERLYIAADGPRKHKLGENDLCDETRKAVLGEIDWQCEIKTLFREENLGCAEAVYGAITWFFEQEEWGVIIEDDVVVGQDFFRLCEDLLPRYKDEERVMEISAENRSGRSDIGNSYVYSLCYRCWGWATWRRAWQKMDMQMQAVDHLSLKRLVRKLGGFQGTMMYYYFKQGKRHLATFSSWATRWFLTIYEHDGLVISPGVNLALNIGTDGGAHYEQGDVNPYSHLTIGRLQWPLCYNDHLEPDKLQTRYDRQDFHRVRTIGLRKLIRKSPEKMGGVNSSGKSKRGFFDVDFHNMSAHDSRWRFAIRYVLNNCRTWWYFHVRWPWVRYDGFVRVMKGCSFAHFDIRMGHNVQFGDYCNISAPVHFGNNILLAGRVCFVGKNDHQTDTPEQLIWDSERKRTEPSEVGNDVWLGHRVTVVGPVHIGAGSVVAAGAVVTHDIPPCEVWGGVPARKIRNRFADNEERERHLAFLQS